MRKFGKNKRLIMVFPSHTSVTSLVILALYQNGWDLESGSMYDRLWSKQAKNKQPKKETKTKLLTVWYTIAFVVWECAGKMGIFGLFSSSVRKEDIGGLIPKAQFELFTRIAQKHINQAEKSSRCSFRFVCFCVCFLSLGVNLTLIKSM